MSIKNNQLEKPFTTQDKDKLDSVTPGAEPNPTTATQEEAEAGVDNAKMMTPLRVWQAIQALLEGLDAEVLQTEAVNGSGDVLLKATPVRADDTTKKLNTINVSTESEALATIGLVKEDAASEATTTVMMAGRLKDVNVSGSIEDSVFVSKTGGLTTTPPDIGIGDFVEGDFVIYIGTLAQNEDDSLKKDIIINIEKRGQL